MAMERELTEQEKKHIQLILGKSQNILKTTEKVVELRWLLNRWKGASHKDIIYLEYIGRISVFNLDMTLILPNEEKEKWLIPTRLEIIESIDGNEIFICLTGHNVYILLKEVYDIEKEYPYFLYERYYYEPKNNEEAVIVDVNDVDEDYTADDNMDTYPSYLDVLEEDNKKLEAALADSRAENDKLRAENEELKNVALRGGEDGKNGQDEEFPAEYEDHGLFTVVAKLVDARAPVVEIMAALDEEKEFLSQRENGYFFHPNPTGKSVSTLRNYTKNTLKKRVAKGS